MEIYTVRRGDSLPALSRRFALAEGDIASLNRLSDPVRLTEGQALLLPQPCAPGGSMEAGLCLSPGIPPSALGPLLPELSFVCLPCRGFSPEGRLADPVRSFTALGCPALLGLANLDASGLSSPSLSHSVLSCPKSAAALLSSVAAELEAQGLCGLYLCFSRLYPFDRELFSAFVSQAAELMHSRGLYLFLALPPKEALSEQSLICAAHDYALLGEAADRLILLSYDWGHCDSAPQACAPLPRIRRVLDYASGVISPGKLLLALPAHGYNWRLPWRSGDSASPIDNASAAALAVSLSAPIRFDRAFQAPYFTYTDPLGRRHIVWFEDARSTAAKLSLAEEYSLAGFACMPGSRPPFPGPELILSRFTAEPLP